MNASRGREDKSDENRPFYKGWNSEFTGRGLEHFHFYSALEGAAKCGFS